MCEWALLQCRRYPGIHIGLGRKELKRLEQTTLATLLTEAHPAMGVKEPDFTYNAQKSFIRYRNGSQITLVDIDRMPSDPLYERLGSLNFTHVIIEEAGEIEERAYSVFGSRKNRKLNKEYSLTGKLIATCNPSDNFLRHTFYEPYLSGGGGRYQKWQHGNVIIKGEKKPAYRVFVRSLVGDNPFIDPNYRESLLLLPEVERKRLLDGDWDFANNDYAVFPQWVLDRMTVQDIPEEGIEYVAMDVSEEGADKSVISRTKGGVLIDQHEINIPKGQQLPVTDLLGAEFYAYCLHHEIPANRTAIDGVGVGAGVVSYLRAKGFYTHRYIGGESVPRPNPKDSREESRDLLSYRNVRSAAFWKLGQMCESGEARVWAGLATKEKLWNQLRPIEYKIDNDKVLALETKDKLKAKLGGTSPDHADSWNMANWIEHMPKDHRHNLKRIGL